MRRLGLSRSLIQQPDRWGVESVTVALDRWAGGVEDTTLRETLPSHRG